MLEKLNNIKELIDQYIGIPFGELEDAIGTPMSPTAPHGAFLLDIDEVNRSNNVLMRELRDDPNLILVAGFDKAGFRFIKKVAQVDELDFIRMEIDDALKDIEQNERAFHVGVHSDGAFNAEFKKGIVKPPILRIEVVE